MPVRLKIIFRKFRRLALRFILLLLLAFLLFEVLYRYQVVDTYRRELSALNPNTEPDKRGILVMGDSFSATQNNWVDRLRKLRGETPILNAAVPGTGVRQAGFMARRRFKTSQPAIFIYQIYLGNDLFDQRFPLNWSQIGALRNVYWGISNHFRSLSWLNYAMGQFKAAPPPPGTSDGKTTEQPFSPDRFSPRTKLYLQAEPDLVQASIRLTGRRKNDFESYVTHLKDLLDHCENRECQTYLVLIPHCAQVHPRYAANMQALGAQIDQPAGLLQQEYPFLQKLREALLTRTNVEIINPLPALQEMEKAGTPAYYNNDIHLSPAGQARLAQEIDQFLKNHAPPIDHQ